MAVIFTVLRKHSRGVTLALLAALFSPTHLFALSCNCSGSIVREATVQAHSQTFDALLGGTLPADDIFGSVSNTLLLGNYSRLTDTPAQELAQMLGFPGAYGSARGNLDRMISVPSSAILSDRLPIGVRQENLDGYVNAVHPQSRRFFGELAASEAQQIPRTAHQNISYQTVQLALATHDLVATAQREVPSAWLAGHRDQIRSLYGEFRNQHAYQALAPQSEKVLPSRALRVNGQTLDPAFQYTIERMGNRNVVVLDAARLPEGQRAFQEQRLQPLTSIPTGSAPYVQIFGEHVASLDIYVRTPSGVRLLGSQSSSAMNVQFAKGGMREEQSRAAFNDFVRRIHPGVSQADIARVLGGTYAPPKAEAPQAKTSKGPAPRPEEKYGAPAAPSPGKNVPAAVSSTSPTPSAPASPLYGGGANGRSMERGRVGTNSSPSASPRRQGPRRRGDYQARTIRPISDPLPLDRAPELPPMIEESPVQSTSATVSADRGAPAKPILVSNKTVGLPTARRVAGGDRLHIFTNSTTGGAGLFLIDRKKLTASAEAARTQLQSGARRLPKNLQQELEGYLKGLNWEEAGQFDARLLEGTDKLAEMWRRHSTEKNIQELIANDRYLSRTGLQQLLALAEKPQGMFATVAFQNSVTGGLPVLDQERGRRAVSDIESVLRGFIDLFPKEERTSLRTELSKILSSSANAKPLTERILEGFVFIGQKWNDRVSKSTDPKLERIDISALTTRWGAFRAVEILRPQSIVIRLPSDAQWATFTGEEGALAYFRAQVAKTFENRTLEQWSKECLTRYPAPLVEILEARIRTLGVTDADWKQAGPKNREATRRVYGLLYFLLEGEMEHQRQLSGAPLNEMPIPLREEQVRGTLAAFFPAKKTKVATATK